MLFNSLTFLAFFALVAVLYWLFPHKARWILLLVASYVFYAFWNPAYLLLLFGSSLVTYLLGLFIERKPAQAKLWLVLTIIACFGALVYFKYADLFGQSLNGIFGLLGVELNIPLFNILLPIGISFQMFQNVGYAVDIYRKKVPAEPNFFRYALFAGYFPQLVAGPIERAANLMPQLRERHEFTYSETTLGLRMMLIGFFKKVAVADTIAIYVDAVYNQLGSGFSGLALALATILFAFQIYCDFSGYSDIAVGASKVFGINLMINFKSPYYSRNIQEFWRRWHISLSTWFQDYVYIPLGGSRVKLPRYALNLLITFTISGLWHGADWSFVIWGLLHGLFVAGYFLISRAFKKRRERKGQPESSGLRSNIKTVLSVALNFVIVDILWIFFRCNSMQEVAYVFTHLFTGWSFSLGYVKEQLVSMGFTPQTLVVVILLLAALFIVDKINYREDVSVVLTRQRLGVRWAVYLVGSFAIIAAFMFTSASQNFIYFQF